MTDANAAPSPWELSRGMEHISKQVDRLEGKVDELTRVGVGFRLNEIDRRIAAIEGKLTKDASQRSLATWQVLFIVLAALLAFGSALAVAVVAR